MAKITFIEASGKAKVVDVPDGWNLMQAAAVNQVEGVLGECGGSGACGTCHCYVDDRAAALLPPPSTTEEDLLGFVAAERRANSRLSCQIKAGPELDGIVVHFPDTQV